MILVHGSDTSFVNDVVDHLEGCGHQARSVDAEAHLFSEVVAQRAQTVIGVAPLRDDADEEQKRALVDDLIAASSAPSAPRIVLVTPGPLDGPHVTALKRSGAPYIVVSSLGLRRSEVALPPRRTVWLSRRLLEPGHELVTKSALLCTVAKAVAEETYPGVELAPEVRSWTEELGTAGVRVVPVPNWLARLAYLCGAPALFVATGRVRIRLRDEEEAPVFGLLPPYTERMPALLGRARG